MRPISGGLSLAFLAGLGGAILATVYACSQVSFASNEELAISVTTETSDVELGRAFPLTVVRTWGASLNPRAFDERSLAPLVTRLQSTVLRESDTRAEETRRYLAYAFSLDSLVIPAVAFEASEKWSYAPSDPVRVNSAPLRLRVHAVLDPKSPGAPEGPGPMLRNSRRWLPWTIGGAAALLLALVAARRRSRTGTRTPVPPPIPVGPGPDVEALAGLARLRARGGAGADVVEASDLVRTYAARRFSVPAGEMTSAELVAALAPVESTRTSLKGVLDPSDLVKFADHAPTRDETARALDAAEAFVLATRTTP